VNNKELKVSLYGYFDHSIAGLRAAEALLDQAARVIADPDQWYGTAEQQAPSSFNELIATQLTAFGQRGPGPGGAESVKSVLPAPGFSMMDDLGVGMQMGPQDLLDAMIALIIAQRMYEANARVFAIENRVVGIIIHLGEEYYRPDGS